MKNLTVEFTARFVAKIQVDNDASEEDIQDAIADIDIPENSQCKYLADTFEPDDPDNPEEIWTAEEILRNAG